MKNELSHHNEQDSSGLNGFIQEWGRRYVERNNTISLFDPEQNSKLNLEQKKFFTRAFYHARGHFNTFLWYMGSLAPSEDYKKIIINNMQEEFGGNKRSHEQLYMEFAQALGVDIIDEIRTERTNLPFIRKFNHGHIQFLLDHDWDHKWAALSAYELLDNKDYQKLSAMAGNFVPPGRPRLFFDVHRSVKHFDQTHPLLEQTWQRNPMAVRTGFDFIGEHQTKLWRELSKATFLTSN